MVFQQGSTSVQMNSFNDLSNEINHLSTICSQPCVFTGPDAEAGALTYAGVRVLLLRAIEQEEQMRRLFASVQTLSQETRVSITSCMDELNLMRNHISTLQQNMQEVYTALQGHGSRLDQLDAFSRQMGGIEGVFKSYEQRIDSNASAIGRLDQQQQELGHAIRSLGTSEILDRRIRDLNEAFNQRLMSVEHSVRDIHAQKADLSAIPGVVMTHVQTSLSPLELDVHALLRLWDLNKSDVHSVVHSTSSASVQNRVQLLHGTPAFQALMDLMRAPALPTVTVGPASAGGASSISVTSNEVYGGALSPRMTAQNQSQSYLGIEVGPGGGPNSGVIITRVLPGTPAAVAGLQVGDTVIAMNGSSVSTVTELVTVMRQCIASKPPGGCYVVVTRRDVTMMEERVNVWLP